MAANAFSTMGGSADAITCQLDETHPIDNISDIEEAVAYANEAMEAAQRLEESQLADTLDPVANKLLNVAVENYIERFSIPAAALESNDEPLDGEPEGASRLKKVVLYLYAVVQRIFKAIFDLFRNQKNVARKIMTLTKQYIGEADLLSSSVASQLNVKDRSLMVALQIDGIVPKKVPELFDSLATAFEQQHSFAAVPEVIRLIAAAKDKNEERVNKAAVELRGILEEGFKKTLSTVSDPHSVPVFSEKKSDNANYYISEPMFGHNYIYGIVAKDVNADGTFRFKCGIQRDAEVPLRVPVFPVLTPDEIRAVCRTSLRICENIIRFSRDEELMQKALREATFLTTKEADKSAVAALRNFTNVGQNSYIVYLRFTTRTMQALMRWCAASIKRYGELTRNE